MTPAIRLLIIGEHPAVREALATRFRSLPQFVVTGVIPRPTAGALDDWSPAADVVLLSVANRNDLELDQALALTRQLAARGAAVIVLAPIAGELEQRLYREAGAFRCLQQHVNTPELIEVIRQAHVEQASGLREAIQRIAQQGRM